MTTGFCIGEMVAEFRRVGCGDPATLALAKTRSTPHRAAVRILRPAVLRELLAGLPDAAGPLALRDAFEAALDAQPAPGPDATEA